MLKSKLKQVTVTDANVQYNGSITLDPSLMEAANLRAYERVEVNAVHGTARLITYVLPGINGSGQVEMNGGMANFFKPGDKVHVNCFAFYDEDKIDPFFKPKVVITDERNMITDIK